MEQTGTEADCSAGAATCPGRNEIFPNAPVSYPDPVQPGDAMSASVTSDGGGTFTLTLSDAAQGLDADHPAGPRGRGPRLGRGHRRAPTVTTIPPGF